MFLVCIVGLLGLSPELGQRVHFAEGTNLRCREDKKPSDDSEERLAMSGGEPDRNDWLGAKAAARGGPIKLWAVDRRSGEER